MARLPYKYICIWERVEITLMARAMREIKKFWYFLEFLQPSFSLSFDSSESYNASGTPLVW